MRSAVWGSDWDVILFNHDKSFLDYCTVLNVLKESGKDIPFIIYSDVSDERSNRPSVAMRLKETRWQSLLKKRITRLIMWLNCVS